MINPKENYTFKDYLNRFKLLFIVGVFQVGYRYSQGRYSAEVLVGGIVLAVFFNYLIFILWRKFKVNKLKRSQANYLS